MNLWAFLPTTREFYLDQGVFYSHLPELTEDRVLNGTRRRKGFHCLGRLIQLFERMKEYFCRIEWRTRRAALTLMNENPATHENDGSQYADNEKCLQYVFLRDLLSQYREPRSYYCPNSGNGYKQGCQKSFPAH